MSSSIQDGIYVPQLIPCIGCVHRLTSNPPRQHEPCLTHSSATVSDCVMCTRKKQRCFLLPVRAMELGRKFQNACVSRFEGEEVADLQTLGEKTLQAIGTPQGQTGKHGRSSTAPMARMPVDPDSILNDGGSAAFTGGQFSVSGQPQVAPQGQQSPQQQQRQEVAQQLNVEPQPASFDTRRKLEVIRVQMESMEAQMESMKTQMKCMKAQVQDLIQ